MWAYVNRKNSKSTKSKSEGSQDRDKGEKEAELESKKRREEWEKKHKDAAISPHAFLRFAEIHNPLSSFPHPRSFSSFHNSKHWTNPLVHFKTPLFLIAVKVVTAQMCCALIETQAAKTASDKHLSLLLWLLFVCFDLSSCSDQKKNKNKVNGVTQYSVAGYFTKAKYTLLHSSLVIFLMASVQSCCKVSPGQILSLPLSSTALIPLASGHSQACREKSHMHHWRRADTPPPILLSSLSYV